MTSENTFSNSRAFGHLIAIFTIMVWGTTYISTKVLLTGFRPTEILLIRFVIGYLVLFLLHPHVLRFQGLKTECLFALCGLTGITGYYLLENISLTMTQASNVGVIICTAPFFTALLSRLIWKKEAPLRPLFFLGFVMAMAGIALISFNGEAVSISLKGDLLALLAAVMWSLYSILLRLLSREDLSIIQISRRFFAYAILFMIPALFFMPFHPDLTLLAQPRYILNLLYLGIIASALCFIGWNQAVRILGAVTTSVYIYLTPVVTIITSMIVLGERLVPLEWLGVCLTMAGLILSQYKNW